MHRRDNIFYVFARKGISDFVRPMVITLSFPSSICQTSTPTPVFRSAPLSVVNFLLLVHQVGSYI